MQANALIRQARKNAGLTQARLAARLGVSQAALAHLERPGSNPTVRTLDRVLAATGHRLELSAARAPAAVDEKQLRRHLWLTPAERLRLFEASHANLVALQRRAQRVG